MTMVYGRSIGRALPRLGALRSVLSCSRFGNDIRYLSTTAQRYAGSDAKLDLPALDHKWRQKWAALQKTNTTNDGAQKKYVLPMFPYPSGYLHLGHLRVYTIADVVARFHSLQGHDVLLPMGWDAFGLPAENAAIERGINPATWTKSNIAKMKEQLDIMNGSWDWSRELATCDPSFYKHTQKIFLLLHEQGLAYQDEAEVNYDPVDKTVLANEQVDANGCSWRSGAKVEKRKLKQWFLRISEFRDSLLEDLEVLGKNGDWPERVLAMQKNWLGKSTGATIKFPLMAFEHVTHSAIEVFTSRPDTLFGVQYLALASTHPVVAQLASKDPELQAFLDTLPGLPPDSKVGYLLPHIRAVNPLAYHEETPEATKKSIPIYVAPYVLGDYGEGAVMGVPAHDVRDHSFWKTHHKDEPVRFVLAASEDESTTALPNEPFIDHGVMTAHSGLFKGRSSKEAGEMLVRILEEAELAKPVEKWRLRDWLVSRQRYWGTPIPIIHCDSCGAVPVPEEQLPVELPKVDEHWAGKKIGNPLETLDDWVNTPCPKCHGPAKRDTDTMDTFVDSSWYFARFIDPHNNDAPFSAEKAKKMLPVDLYIGGVEHAILHLLYSRFIYKFLMSSSLAGGETKGVQEPFKRLITQGMVHGKTYTDPATGRFLKPDEVDLSDPSKPVVVATGETAGVSYEKMSKSKHNGVDPTDVINLHGADATRAHMLFQAPVSEVLDWDEEKIVGVTRWLGRVWELVQRVSSVPEPRAPAREFFEQEAGRLGKMSEKELQQWDKAARVWREVQKTIGSVTGSYEKVYALNTVVSDLMILTNVIVEEEKGVPDRVKREAVEGLVRMMAPITPAFAEECWAVLHPGEVSIFKSEKGRFPVVDGTVESLLQPRKQICAVQVNGRLKFATEIAVPPEGLGEEERRAWVVGEVMKTEEGSRKLEGVDVGKAKKVVVVKGGKLVNFVM
ncbi:putative leucyl-tRNA synthetase mitochondrial precursor [Cercophora samala]|uniref:leucine--tRNA ligase n=1 Tax=Cercophora samala TaxID=330535 RepID=A0AA40DEI6_9PEZI|nr:putative leucyl-tRNA synthetase mitochondrial precursor [Cercophora samala]